jgi:regulator of replication initiation timing
MKVLLRIAKLNAVHAMLLMNKQLNKLISQENLLSMELSQLRKVFASKHRANPRKLQLADQRKSPNALLTTLAALEVNQVDVLNSALTHRLD